MPAENFIDLEAIIKEWARSEFDAIASKKQKKLREKELAKRQSIMSIAIDWSEVSFLHHTVEFPIAEYHNSMPQGRTMNEGDALMASKGLESGLVRNACPNTSVLFQTTFKNGTDRDQEYTMRTEKTTKSAFMTEIESGYSNEFELSVTLKTPCEIFEANAGFRREYSLTKTCGQTFEEELHWGVDSVIKVKEKHVAEAQLVVFEEKKNGSFIVKTTISGRVYVNFTNIRDNNSLVLSTSEDICSILDDYVTKERTKRGHSMDFIECDSTTGLVVVTTKGICKFQYGIRQEIEVDQRPLSAIK